MNQYNIGFLGAGGIAKAHAYALQSLKFYYPHPPQIQLISVCSLTEKSRNEFVQRYGFETAQTFDEFVKNPKINTVFILGPNNTHFEHFKAAIRMPGVKFIYLEKPVCSTQSEEAEMAELLEESHKIVQIGFQYLQTPSVREALKLWHSGILGKPVHFDVKYYHGDYLQPLYRLKRKTRLTAAPDGGAMADLGSHGLSLLVAFLGTGLRMVSALQAGAFSDVSADSDLFSAVSLVEPKTGAAGHMSASRISSGSGDLVELEIYAENGALRFASKNPDRFEYYLEGSNQWSAHNIGSNYSGITSFPSGHVPPGWLRSMVHAHYIFLGGNDQNCFIPDLSHGLEVQRLVRETAHHLDLYRQIIAK